MLGIIIPISIMFGLFIILFISAWIERLTYKRKSKKIQSDENVFIE